MTAPLIIPLEKRHLAAAADLHLRAFPDFFLSRLGRRFVTELYRGYATGADPEGLVSLDSTGKVQGVLLGNRAPRRFYRRLTLRRGWVFAVVSLPVLVRDPSIAWRLTRALRYRGTSPGRPDGALLTSIAVEPAVQGGGVGRRLITAWLERMKQACATRAYLTTDAEANTSVNQFYQRLGWKIEAVYTTPEGRRMNLYVYIF